MSQYFKTFYNIFLISYLCTIFLVKADIDQKVTDSLQHFQEECGSLPEKEKVVAKIVGGVEAKSDEEPWMVFVESYISPTKRGRCGGSLIGPRHVLTAAHCFREYTDEGVEAGFYKVYMGDVDIDLMRRFNKRPRGCASVNKFKYVVTGVHRHPKYKVINQKMNVVYDMAILVLDRDVIVSSTTPVKPICLPDADFNTNIDNKNVDIMGWGATEIPKSTVPPKPPSRLRKAQTKIWLNQLCQSFFKKHLIARNRICVGDKDHYFGQGDSGSPIILPIDNRYFQVGIFVMGPNADMDKLFVPGLSERVTFHIDWIKTTVKDTLKTLYEMEAQYEGYN